MSLYEERKRLEQEDGEPLHTLRVTPDSEVAVQCNGAGVLVVGDGAEPVVRQLAELGYFVVAIGLRDDPEIAINDIASALLYLKELAGGRLAVFGIHAPIVIEAATRLPQIDCVVTTGGPAPRKGVKLSRSRSSMLILRGAKTSPMSGEDYFEMSKRIEPAKQVMMIRNFDASDGFFTQPADDDERDYATEAFDVLQSFLAQNIV